MEVMLATTLLASLLCLGQAVASEARARALRLLAPTPVSPQPSKRRWLPPEATRRWMLGGVAAVGGGMIGLRLAGPVGFLGGAVAGWALPRAVARRRSLRRSEQLERQLAEVVETSAQAVRSGLSIGQALEFATWEAEPPMRALMRRLVAERAVGATFEEALQRFGAALGSDDALLFVLILSIHLRSGGNLAGPLEEVSTTIRHRLGVRRELRSLTAQGRVSGTILGALPIGFFLVLSATSHRELAPIYRSAAGVAMLSAGLVLEGLAYVWIRRLMRVRA